MTQGSKRWFAVAGVAATASGLAAGHLIAALVAPSASPVVAIGRRVVDATPTPVKEWAVATLGTADKAVLIGGVVLVTLALGAVVGLASRRGLAWGTAAGGALALVALIAAPGADASFPAWAIPAPVAFGVGSLVLARLRAHAESWVETGSGASRRALLRGSAISGGAAVAVALLGESVTRTVRPGLAVAPEPTPAVPVGPSTPLPSGLADAPGVSPLFTPNADFYRIDTALTIPVVDANTWRLSIGGMVDAPFSITWPELVAMDAIERDVTLACVSNDVGGEYIGNARWRGVAVAGLLARAGVQSGADQVLSRSVDGFTVSTPIEALTDGRGAMLAYAMNGAALPPVHGFPVRLLTPGLYGFVGATKWVMSLKVTTYGRDPAYWTERGWATDSPILPSSRIETPRGGSVGRGAVKVGGVAWAHGVGVGGVQVRVDRGSWQDATLGPDAGIECWRQWVWSWDAPVGVHTLQCRVLDADGRPQSENPLPPFPSGASGLHTIQVTVG